MSKKIEISATTRDMIRRFIDLHNAVRDFQKKLKEAKSQRQLVEKDLAARLQDLNVDVLDLQGYRLYRYDDRLIPYHLSTTS